jgi:hypothetical protein
VHAQVRRCVLPEDMVVSAAATRLDREEPWGHDRRLIRAFRRGTGRAFTCRTCPHSNIAALRVLLGRLPRWLPPRPSPLLWGAGGGELRPQPSGLRGRVRRIARALRHFVPSHEPCPASRAPAHDRWLQPAPMSALLWPRVAVHHARPVANRLRPFAGASQAAPPRGPRRRHERGSVS